MVTLLFFCFYLKTNGYTRRFDIETGAIISSGYFISDTKNIYTCIKYYTTNYIYTDTYNSSLTLRLTTASASSSVKLTCGTRKFLDDTLEGLMCYN